MEHESLPTGTEMGAPVSRACMPRDMPSVGRMEMQRTVSSPVCWATSTMMWLPSSLSTLMRSWTVISLLMSPVTLLMISSIVYSRYSITATAAVSGS